MRTVNQNAVEYIGGTDLAEILQVTYMSVYNWSKILEDDLLGYQIFERDEKNGTRLYSQEDVEKFQKFQQLNKNTEITRNEALIEAFGDPEKKGDIVNGKASPEISPEAQLTLDEILKKLVDSEKRAADKDQQLISIANQNYQLVEDRNKAINDQQKLLEENSKISAQNEELTKAVKETNDQMKELLDMAKAERSNNNKGFWSRLFGK